jgi:Ni,Fe-hydrogenase III large subunit
VLVRAEEFYESLSIVEFCLNNMPEGPVLAEGFDYQPHRFALGYVEAPRGEDVHWTMLGDNQKVYRWRPRAPTYNNWPPLRDMLRGNTISDAPLIVASLDPCYSCTERVTIVDIKKSRITQVPYKEMERYCRERKDSPLKR